MTNIENQDFIFHQKQVIEKQDSDEFYTITGEEDFLDEFNNPRLIEDNKKTLAKKIYNEKKVRYLIKINTDGKLHNPINVTSKQINNGNFLDKTCKQPKFKTVSYETFGMYLNFLKSKNLSWLHNANRKVE
jgi:hypothetical protein